MAAAYDVAANAFTHARTERAVGAWVVVFPELSLTGYELDARAVAPDDTALAPLVETGAAMDALALVGAPVEDEDHRAFIAILGVAGAGVRVVRRRCLPGRAGAQRPPVL